MGRPFVTIPELYPDTPDKPGRPPTHEWGSEHYCDSSCNAETCWYYAAEAEPHSEWANPFPPGGAGDGMMEGY